MKKRLSILLISIVILISALNILTFTNYEKKLIKENNNENLDIAFYNGNEKLDEMPSKDNSDNLVFDYASCDNDAYVLWDEKEWAPLVKNLSKSKTKCTLYFRKYNAADYINNLAKTDTTNLIADDTNDANIRYVGATPNNYIDIGDKDSAGQPILWRIIGVMNNITNLDNDERKESLLKIIRAESIGDYSWDSSASEINEGFGINEWSEADIMKLLNPNTVYNGTPTIGGSLYWNQGSGSCYSGPNETNETCNFTNSGLSEEAKKRIAKVRWNTGTGADSFLGNGYKYTPKYIYDGERSAHNGKEQCVNTGENQCNDKIERKNIWDGYIGLIYPSDYGYAVGGIDRNTCLEKALNNYSEETCNINNWLKPLNDASWTMTPVPFLTNADLAFVVTDSGLIVNYQCINSISIFPVAYLKSNFKIIPNPHSEQEYGSENNPFVIEPSN